MSAENANCAPPSGTEGGHSATTTGADAGQALAIHAKSDVARVATNVSTTSTAEPEALLALPPPPSYDVFVQDLSIAAPPYAAYIPTPIPIKIPQPITRFVLNHLRPQRLKDLEKGGDELIVRNVSANVRAGEMMAIIGGSGSGKTTLLHAIANRLGNLPIASGGVVFTHSADAAGPASSSSPAKLKGMSKVIGFVRQFDYLLPHLTVRETLNCAAQLRLPASVDHATRALIVEQTIIELGLSDAANTIVGGAGRKGISGGEKRRLSIGCVLVSFPSVLVLDEPTTGLDSFTAFQLLATLSRLAKRGRTIILSLHQPRSDAFPLFDRLVLLSRGNLVYAGQTKLALPHFASLGYRPEVDVNPLDFMIDVSSVDVRDEDAERESRVRVDRLVAAWKLQAEDGVASPTKGRSRSASVAPAAEGGAQSAPEKTMSGARPNVFTQFSILFPRSVKNAIRAYPELVGHLLTAIIIGLLIGITFYRLEEQPNDIQSLKTLTFQVVPVYGYMTQVSQSFGFTSGARRS
ncbi:P-loop containing nucleoside triphosphate hydrolase protein [Auricularia subglabra TFB-10046 SS5]|uniref:p-loop containing nucleoside triphosphate hydrolase protein n=1 Tax=Auricularia subglabra (strain TFB-10046 / SS5) TaxID=717982 RepID=J0LBB7_AURST|nr:P-loop containing nucleoside triphosphate hydrolase protein [Auricularia subglabra TFB-10046 SS5]